MSKRFGILSVADVMFIDTETNKLELLFDSLKVATIENESDSAEARGGGGGTVRVSWNFNRTATLTMEDALLSMASVAALAGTEIEEATTVTGRETIVIPEGGTVTLSNTPVDGSITAYNLNGGMGAEEVSAAGPTTGAEVSGLTPGERLTFVYEYEAPAGSELVRFTSNAFPKTYKVIGDTVVRDEIGNVDRTMQFYIPRAQLQSNFNITLDAENVSTFDFNLNIMKDAESDDLYQLIKLA